MEKEGQVALAPNTNSNSLLFAASGLLSNGAASAIGSV